MKMRPQVSGPTDVGFGNYILTAPANREGRQLDQQLLNVDDLLADINTLSNPRAKKERKRSEL
jgi:hypothetical protein